MSTQKYELGSQKRDSTNSHPSPPVFCSQEPHICCRFKLKNNSHLFLLFNGKKLKDENSAMKTSQLITTVCGFKAGAMLFLCAEEVHGYPETI